MRGELGGFIAVADDELNDGGLQVVYKGSLGIGRSVIFSCTFCNTSNAILFLEVFGVHAAHLDVGFGCARRWYLRVRHVFGGCRRQVSVESRPESEEAL